MTTVSAPTSTRRSPSRRCGWERPPRSATSPVPPRAVTRGAWVSATLPVWQELAEPVATSIADALTAALGQQAPDDMQDMIAGAGRLMRTVGGSLFATQLGQSSVACRPRSSAAETSASPSCPTARPRSCRRTSPTSVATSRSPRIIGPLPRDPRTRSRAPVPSRPVAAPARHLAGARLRPRHPRRHRRPRRPRLALRPDAARRTARRPRERCPAARALRRADRGPHAPREPARHDRGLGRRRHRGRHLACPRPDASPRPCAAAARWAPPRAGARRPRRPRAARPRRMREAAAMWRAVTDAVGVDGRDGCGTTPTSCRRRRTSTTPRHSSRA